MLWPVRKGTMSVRKGMCLLFVVALLLTGCTKDKTGSTQRTDSGVAARRQELVSSGGAPAIISAKIANDNPGSDVKLQVHFSASGPEGEEIRYLFRWYVDDSIVQESDLPELGPGVFKKGSKVYVDIIPSTQASRGQPFRTDAIKVGNLPPVVSSANLTPPNPVLGDVITISAAGEDPDGDSISYRYQWTVNGEYRKEIPSDSKTFTTNALKKGDEICVVVTPSDGESDGASKLSNVVRIGNLPPRITSVPPTMIGGGTYTYQVTAQDPDGDALTYALVQAPPGMTIDRTTGLIRWEPNFPIDEKNNALVKISVDDGDGGVASQEFTLVLEKK